MLSQLEKLNRTKTASVFSDEFINKQTDPGL
jgi:hypothetical protein